MHSNEILNTSAFNIIIAISLDNMDLRMRMMFLTSYPGDSFLNAGYKDERQRPTSCICTLHEERDGTPQAGAALFNACRIYMTTRTRETATHKLQVYSSRQSTRMSEKAGHRLSHSLYLALSITALILAMIIQQHSVGKVFLQ